MKRYAIVTVPGYSDTTALIGHGMHSHGTRDSSWTVDGHCRDCSRDRRPKLYGRVIQANGNLVIIDTAPRAEA